MGERSMFAPPPERAYEPKRTLEQIRSLGRPRATGQSAGLVVEAKEGATPEAVALAAEANRRIDEYLRPFVAPEEDGGCIMCGSPQGGFFGSFVWGLAHGEGRCSRCGYPARALHYIKLDDSAEPGELKAPVILQYHPDELRERQAEERHG